MAYEPGSPSPNPSSPPPPLRRWGRPRAFGYRRHHRGHGIIPGLVLIAWGGLLLLREAGVLSPAVRPMDLWPLVIMGLGLSIAVRRRHLGGILVGLAIMLLGAGLLAQGLGHPMGVARLWPVLLVAAGIGVIWSGLTRRAAAREANEQVSAGDLHRSVTMGDLALAIDSQEFRGGSLTVTMGEVRADFRRAAIAGEEATLDLSLTMGNIELYVPGNWEVVSDVSPFMGVVEDKTEPRPDAAGVKRRLVLRGKIDHGSRDHQELSWEACIRS